MKKDASPRGNESIAPQQACPAILNEKHLYLTGYRGSGKSSVGRAVARRLQRPWIDLDDEIESQSERSIQDIFASDGEEGFRNLEQAVLEAVSKRAPAVISLGGGAVLREANRKRIRGTGVSVWLQVDADTVLQRLHRDASTSRRRPPLTGLPPRQEIQTLLAKREPLYAEVASYQIDTTGRGVRAITNRVLQAIGATLDQPPKV